MSNISANIMEGWSKRFQELQVASETDAENSATRIVDFICTELCDESTNDVPNQVFINLAVRFYFEYLHKHNLEDRHFQTIIADERSYHSERVVQTIYAVLQTGRHCQLNLESVKEHCLNNITGSKGGSEHTLLALLRVLNLLCKKFPGLSSVDLPLNAVYHCLQNGVVGLRDEVLTLVGYCCRRSADVAFRHFQFVMEFWPWTNRNKLYMLSAILGVHNLLMLLESAQQTVDRFFAGLRMSLSCKRLLPASQHLVKALSAQDSHELLHLAAEILTRGTRTEIQNFQAQWFVRITQRDTLFELLQGKPEISCFLADPSSTARDADEHYRLILIFGMFARQIFAVSMLHFFAISTDLITSCFQLEMAAQMLIYKFVVDNVASFAIEDCLEFVLAFVQHHRGVDNSQNRQDILGKMPTIVNHIAKVFSKLNASDACTTLEDSITSFFRGLQQQIEEDMTSGEYQPKIFALRLCEIVLKSLYATKVVKNAKNCNTAQNQQLGRLLIGCGVFAAPQMARKLLSLLDDPVGYDDAQDLIISLLALLDQRPVAVESVSLCKSYSQRNDVDEYSLGVQYAKVALRGTSACENAQVLFGFAWEALGSNGAAFEDDSLLVCKTGRHIFGFLQVINEVVKVAPTQVPISLNALIDAVEAILNTVLGKLNLANLRNETDATTADFQDMDESLRLLVAESAWKPALGEHDECRRILLLTFWLTLKGCCDLATTIGCQLVATSGGAEHLVAVKSCLEVNIAVLTRCRHKGAIEAAGLSIGKLTRCITNQLVSCSPAYDLLAKSLELLFDPGNHASTSRRGAGLSIMFLHVVKNDSSGRRRPLLVRALQLIFQRLQVAKGLQSDGLRLTKNNCDRLEALTLHYLCVLARDTELRDSIAPFYNEILVAAIMQIENTEWTVCNAALQLVGALIPKIVGQGHVVKYGKTPVTDTNVWGATEVTYAEIAHHLPKACEDILQHCTQTCERRTSTRSIILFLGFLASVEHLRMSDAVEEQTDPLLLRFRELSWSLLSHTSEKVRQLAAVCCVRSHEFRADLHRLLLGAAHRLFRVVDENLFDGFVCTLSEGVAKFLSESKYTLDRDSIAAFMARLRGILAESFRLERSFKLYTLCKLLDLLLAMGFASHSKEVAAVLATGNNILETTSSTGQMIGLDLWLQKSLVKD